MSEAPVVPVVVAPVESSSSLAEPADVSLVWSDPTELLWPGAAGVVTSVELTKGDVVTSGRLVAAVNGSGVRKPVRKVGEQRAFGARLVVCGVCRRGCFRDRLVGGRECTFIAGDV